MHSCIKISQQNRLEIQRDTDPYFNAQFLYVHLCICKLMQFVCIMLQGHCTNELLAIKVIL